MQEFPTAVAAAAAAHPDTPVYILIDAVNQLQDVDRARTLDWLPTTFPPNVHVIVSCTEGSCAGGLILYVVDNNLLICFKSKTRKEIPIIGKA